MPKPSQFSSEPCDYGKTGGEDDVPHRDPGRRHPPFTLPSLTGDPLSTGKPDSAQLGKEEENDPAGHTALTNPRDQRTRP